MSVLHYGTVQYICTSQLLMTYMSVQQYGTTIYMHKPIINDIYVSTTVWYDNIYAQANY